MSAAEPVKIADSVNQITLEFENVEGVECTSIKKGEGELEEGEYVKSYATVNGTTSISDFMAIIEDKESKMFMYMSGELVIKGLKFEF